MASSSSVATDSNCRTRWKLAIEDEILHHAEDAAAARCQRLSRHSKIIATLQNDYIQFLIDCVPGLKLDGLRIVADCANGAAAAVAPELFARLGAQIPDEFTLLNISPDGRNINDGCGALHPNWVAAEVQRRRASDRV